MTDPTGDPLGGLQKYYIPSRYVEHVWLRAEVPVYVADHVDAQIAALQRERDDANRAVEQLDTCQNCGRRYPRSLIAIELKDGAPINNDKFMWCVICHDQRVLATLKEQIQQLREENERLRAWLEIARAARGRTGD